MTPTRYLERLYSQGASKPGLDRVRVLLDRLDNPQDKIACVHVAGTNGKGSTCAFLESILRASGYRTGAFLSPHLSSIREYIMLDGAICPEDVFEEYAARIMDECIAIEQSGGDMPTFFEAMAALAFYIFCSEGVDIAVIETGMGGMQDATNVINPLLSIITAVDYDHMAYLGNEIEQIAAHKAGIIKPGRPVVVAPQAQDAAHAVILQKAGELGCRVVDVSDCSIAVESSKLEGLAFTIDCLGERQAFQTSMPGRHQACNAASAVAAAHILRELGFVKINGESAEHGIFAAKWPGRLEIIRGSVNFFLDGAHNPHGAKALADFIEEQLPHEKPVLVCGLLGTKHAQAMARELCRFTGEVVLTTPDHILARKPDELRPIFEGLGVKVHVREEMEDAVKLAARLTGNGGWVVVAGSLYLMGSSFRVVQGVTGL